MLPVGSLRSCCAEGWQGPCPCGSLLAWLCPWGGAPAAVVAVPELQLSTSWVDFGTCFVTGTGSGRSTLMNLSGCRVTGPC